MSEYDGWLVSDSLAKRSLAVVGHYLMGQIILAFFVGMLILIFTLLGFFLSHLYDAQETQAHKAGCPEAYIQGWEKAGCIPTPATRQDALEACSDPSFKDGSDTAWIWGFASGKDACQGTSNLP